jgi:hypothetical protein
MGLAWMWDGCEIRRGWQKVVLEMWHNKMGGRSRFALVLPIFRRA